MVKHIPIQGFVRKFKKTNQQAKIKNWSIHLPWIIQAQSRHDYQASVGKENLYCTSKFMIGKLNYLSTHKTSNLGRNLNSGKSKSDESNYSESRVKCITKHFKLDWVNTGHWIELLLQTRSWIKINGLFVILNSFHGLICILNL